MKSLLIIAAAALLIGCTSTSTIIRKRSDGSILIISPKDVKIDEINYTTGDQNVWVRGYNSSANTAAMQIQSETLKGVVGAAVESAIKGAK